MSERCLLRLTRISSMSKCQEREPQTSTFLFIEPKTNIAVGSSRANQTLRSDTTLCPVEWVRSLDAYCVSLHSTAFLRFQRSKSVNQSVNERSDAQTATGRTTDEFGHTRAREARLKTWRMREWPDALVDSIWSTPVSLPNEVSTIECAQSMMTWHA
jgi:hypothetical protein